MRLICRGLFIFAFRRSWDRRPLPLDVHDHTEVAASGVPGAPAVGVLRQKCRAAQIDAVLGKKSHAALIRLPMAGLKGSPKAARAVADKTQRQGCLTNSDRHHNAL